MFDVLMKIYESYGYTTREAVANIVKNNLYGLDIDEMCIRDRNYTVTIRMNKEEYNLLQSKVKESGRTQQEVVIKAIAEDVYKRQIILRLSVYLDLDRCSS